MQWVYFCNGVTFATGTFLSLRLFYHGNLFAMGTICNSALLPIVAFLQWEPSCNRNLFTMRTFLQRGYLNLIVFVLDRAKISSSGKKNVMRCGDRNIQSFGAAVLLVVPTLCLSILTAPDPALAADLRSQNSTLSLSTRRYFIYFIRDV